MNRADDSASAPRRTLTGVFWHQGPRSVARQSGVSEATRASHIRLSATPACKKTRVGGPACRTMVQHAGGHAEAPDKVAVRWSWYESSAVVSVSLTSDPDHSWYRMRREALGSVPRTKRAVGPTKR